MNRIKNLTIISLLFLAACSRQEIIESTLTSQEMVFTATSGEPQSKTALLNGSTIVAWSPYEAINVFYGPFGSGRFVSGTNDYTQTTNFYGTMNVFSGSIEQGKGASYFWGVQPFSETNTCDGNSVVLSVPSEQQATIDTFEPGSFPSVAKSENFGLAFYNVCGGVKFSLSRNDIVKVTFQSNNGSPLAGTVRVSMDEQGRPVSEAISTTDIVTLSDPSGFVHGLWYYISLLPGTLEQGFTMKFYTSEGIGVKTVTSSVDVKRSTFGVLPNVDNGVEFVGAQDLAANGTANCYIVSEEGFYKFPTVKGNSRESVGSVDYPCLLWETYGTDETPEFGDLVKYLRHENGYIYFYATGKKGNALISAEDVNGKILWSWHIWMTDQPEDQEYFNNAGTMMDRNLGATSTNPGDVHALGLLYQWGRKDPFIGAASISGNTLAKTDNPVISPREASRYISNNNTLEFSIAQPTIFLTNDSGHRDWYCVSDEYRNDNLWAEEKTIYDPCPAGYHVANKGIWATVFGKEMLWNSSNWDAVNKGMNFAATDTRLGPQSNIWYPAAGQRTETGLLSDTGSWGGYWLNTNNGIAYYSNHLNITNDGIAVDSFSRGRSCGLSVRCQKDEQAKTAVNLSQNGSANSYIVSESGMYKFAANKGNSGYPVGTIASTEVLWESFGTDVSPQTGDLVSSVSSSNGYIYFKASDKKGNAVIAAKDALGKILWSWHIWMTDRPINQVYNNNAGTMMDRNLGATSTIPGDVHALGLLYQWGRKDPFLGGCSTSLTYVPMNQAASTLAWPQSVPRDITTGTIEYTTEHPTTFITSDSDWAYAGADGVDYTRWQSQKTAYDPCPAGYRVADPTVWAFAAGIGSFTTTWDSVNNGQNFGRDGTALFGQSNSIWYPAAGYIPYTGMEYYGSYTGYYWANQPCALLFSISSSTTYIRNDIFLATAKSVRCMKE